MIWSDELNLTSTSNSYWVGKAASGGTRMDAPLHPDENASKQIKQLPSQNAIIRIRPVKKPMARVKAIMFTRQPV